MPSPAPRPLVSLLTTLLIAAPAATAAVDVCRPPSDGTFVALALAHQDRAALTPAGTTRQQVTDTHIQLRLNDHWTTGVRHRYTDLDIDGPALQTNGHVHNFVLPLHWQRQDEVLRISMAPTLSASSNLVTEPGDYEADLLQLLAAIDWRTRIGRESALRYGLCADHRFGEWQVYPVLAVDWRPGDRWRIELGLPDTRIRYELTDTLGLRFTVQPAGNEWRVRDQDGPAESVLTYEAVAFTAGVSLEPMQRLSVDFSVGRHVDAEIEGVLQNGNRVLKRVASATRAEARLAWRFR